MSNVDIYITKVVEEMVVGTSSDADLVCVTVLEVKVEAVGVIFIDDEVGVIFTDDEVGVIFMDDACTCVTRDLVCS